MCNELKFKISNTIKYTIELKADNIQINILIEYDTRYELSSLGLICYHSTKAKYYCGSVITGFECTRVGNDKVKTKILDFMINKEHQCKGLGTFILAKLHLFTPDLITKNLTISGKLTAEDNSPQRNSLYRNLIGSSRLAIDKDGDGNFEGAFNDLSDRYKDKINIIDISFEKRGE